MSMNHKAVDQFESLIKKSNKVGDNAYVISTSSKRKELLVPEGVRVYDQELKKWFTGDGKTYGGRAPESSKGIRRVEAKVSGASGMTWASGTSNSSIYSGIFNWFTCGAASGWRTGDKITLISGASLPGGYKENQAYYVVKPSGEPDAASFQLTSGRAAAFSGQPHSGGGNTSGIGVVSGIPSGGGYSGCQYFMYTNWEFGAQPEDDVLIIAGASGERHIGVILPNVSENPGYSVTIMKPFVGTADAGVWISGQNTTRTIASVNIDTSANTFLNEHCNDFVTVVAEEDSNQYYLVAGSISGAGGGTIG